MKQWLLNWLLKDINRFEVINHNNTRIAKGRCFVHKKILGTTYEEWEVHATLQDDGKTLKIFI